MFKISVEKVKLSSHPNADLLDIIAIGDYQYVVQKGLYKDGDKAVAIPKNSIVNHPVFIREWGPYLHGSEHNKVGFKIMRGEESQGIVVKKDLFKEITGVDLNDFEVGTDVTTLLDVKQYIPEVPDSIKDTVEVYNGKAFTKDIKHDCKYASVLLSKFVEGELVTITSKLHGSQFNILWNYDSNVKLRDRVFRYSSKGLLNEGLVFKKGITNKYTEAWYNFTSTMQSIVFWDILSEMSNLYLFDQEIHIVGEVVGISGGFNYNKQEPTLYIFAIYVNGIAIDLINFRHIEGISIVPELYRGSFNSIYTLVLANDFAQQDVCPLDGTTLNEGVVISNGRHYIKVKNDKFMKKHGTNKAN